MSGDADRGEPDLSWIDIGVDGRGEVYVFDHSPGWSDFGLDHHWEDNFETDAPKLTKGIYRWSDYKLGMWDEGESINATGGIFTPYTLATRIPSDAARKAVVEECAYLVWSNEHRAWWGPNRCGYASTIARAGRYTRGEAIEIASSRYAWPRNGVPDEIAIPEADAIDQAEAAIRALASTPAGEE